MPFNILDYLEELARYGTVKELSTWVACTCPICGGKLKISKSAKYGSYACYSNACHEQNPNPIRRLLYRPTSFNQRTAFTAALRAATLQEIVEPRPIRAEAADFQTSIAFSAPKQLRYPDKLYTYFEYQDFRITRLDTLVDGQREKHLFPEYRDAQGKYCVGVPPTLAQLPLYRLEYLQPNIVFVEGEKCAATAQRLGIAGLTLPTFATSGRYLDRFLEKMVRQGVQNVLVLADNDVVGQRKAQELCKIFWKYGAGAAAHNLTRAFPHFSNETGIDLYDFYHKRLITVDNATTILARLLQVHDE